MWDFSAFAALFSGLLMTVTSFFTPTPAAAPTPSCTIAATPATVEAGESATLTWELKNFQTYVAKNFSLALGATPAPAASKTVTLDCSSSGYAYRECSLGVTAAKIDSITVVKQYSYCNKMAPYDCTPMEGVNYGVKSGNVFWVDKGYRAKFAVAYQPPSSLLNASGSSTVYPDETTTYTINVATGVAETASVKTLKIDCSSNGYAYHECPLGAGVGNITSVGISQQYSYCNKMAPYDCTPMEGTNYGIKNGNILWVDKGYRANFLIEYQTATHEQVGICAATVTVSAEAPDDGPGPCADGTDNDGDGKVDAADASCHSDGNPSNNASYIPVSGKESPHQCMDGIDNDGSGEADYPGDVNCSSASDDNESSPPAPPVSLSLSALPSLVIAGTPTVLTWTAVNAQSCTLSGDNEDSWDLVGVGGSQISAPIEHQTVFTLQCVDGNGEPDSQSLTVYIQGNIREQ